jgi:hypothetical protein
MKRALAEFPGPVAHEALRLRMSAFHGREDPMLEPGRFPRLLRQAHDAEVADVRKIAEDEYEVQGRGLEQAPAPVTATAAAPEAAAPQGSAMAAAPAEAARGGIRFRRGSRLPAALPAIPMVGVVSLEEETAAPAAPAKPHRAGRKKAARTAEAAATAEPGPARRKGGGRPRSRKKAAE